MNSMEDYFFTEENNFTNVKPCIMQKNWFMIGFIPFDAVAICLNVALLAASMIDKEKLQRRNYTLANVNSALLSNTVYLTLKIWGAAASTMAKDSDSALGMPKVLWTVCEAGLTAIGFGVVANASSLIYVTLDSTIVATKSQTLPYQCNDNEKSRLPQKKRTAIVLMVISWIVPIAFIIVATVSWNCAKDCWCPSGNFKGEVCPHDNRCSRLVKPLPTSFLLANASLWCFEIIALIALIIRKSIQYNNSKIFQENGLPAKSFNGVDLEADSMKTTESRNVTQSLGGNIEQFTPKKGLRYNTRFRMAITVTTMLIVCFVPYAVTILIDATKSDANLTPAAIILTVCLYLYMVIFPFLLMKYLPNLKDSLGLLIGRICSLR